MFRNDDHNCYRTTRTVGTNLSKTSIKCFQNIYLILKIFRMAVAFLTDVNLSIFESSCIVNDFKLIYRMLQESFGSIIISSRGVYLSIEHSKLQGSYPSDFEWELMEALSKQKIFSDGTFFSDHFGEKTKIVIVFQETKLLNYSYILNLRKI